MAMTAGTAALETGSLAKAISDELAVEFGAAPDAAQATNRAKAAAAIARAVVAHLAANADVRIKTTDAGLQRDSTGVATTAPAAAKVLAGALE